MSNYKRILLKLSGEVLTTPNSKNSFNRESCTRIAREVLSLTQAGIQVGIVIGAGNLFRGVQGTELGFTRCAADSMGMLGTLINGLAFQEVLRQENVECTLFSSIDCPQIATTFRIDLVNKVLNKGQVAIFGGGTSNPYFTTDSAAALRACEINADILLKATKVNGIYDKDPIKYEDAVRYPTLTYSKALELQLEIMDATAFALCRANKIPIFVFNIFSRVKLADLLNSTEAGTIVKEN